MIIPALFIPACSIAQANMDSTFDPVSDLRAHFEEEPSLKAS